jgi:hypothetical protein
MNHTIPEVIKVTFETLTVGDIICRSLIDADKVFHTSVIVQMGSSMCTTNCVEINSGYEFPRLVSLIDAGYTHRNLHIIVSVMIIIRLLREHYYRSKNKSLNTV